MTGLAHLSRLPACLGGVALACQAAPLERPCAEDVFTTDVVSMGVPQIDYVDPEVLAGTDFATFQTGERRLWLGRIDPQTGLFRSGHGLDLLLDQNLEPVTRSRNGPEWGVSEAGTAVYYVKRDAADLMQLWRARYTRAGVERTQLTFREGASSYGIRPSVIRSRSSVLLFFGVGEGIAYRQVWASEETADDGRVVPDYYAESGGGRFIEAPGTGRIELLHTVATSRLPTLQTQIALLDVESGETRIITDDGGIKYEPRTFRAPEYGDELLLLSIIDRERIAIYRDLQDGSGRWTRVEELELPAGEPLRYLVSIKPVGGRPGRTGVGGVSYFTLAANRDDADFATDAAIWLLGLGTGPERLCRRLDPGAETQTEALRFEPESYLGATELFAFYNAKLGGGSVLLRARTGIAITP